MAETQGTSFYDSEIARQLRKIAGDLWGSSAVPEGEKAPAADKGKKAEPEKKRESEKKAGRPDITIRNLWKTADETIDWTDALSMDYSPDGLTSPGLWRFLHEKAEKVLAGDPAAYGEVLQTVKPLADLKNFAGEVRILPVSGDRLESSFEAGESLMKENGKLYLCAVSLRMARDLFACLPVSEVAVQALWKGQPVMNVTYRRESFLHRNFLFLDPVRFAEECGAAFPKAPET